MDCTGEGAIKHEGADCFRDKEGRPRWLRKQLHPRCLSCGQGRAGSETFCGGKSEDFARVSRGKNTRLWVTFLVIEDNRDA